MFLEIMEGTRIKFACLWEFIGWFFCGSLEVRLFFRLFWLSGNNIKEGLLNFAKELIDVYIGISFLQVGNAFAKLDVFGKVLLMWGGLSLFKKYVWLCDVWHSLGHIIISDNITCTYITDFQMFDNFRW